MGSERTIRRSLTHGLADRITVPATEALIAAAFSILGGALKKTSTLDSENYMWHLGTEFLFSCENNPFKPFFCTASGCRCLLMQLNFIDKLSWQRCSCWNGSQDWGPRAFGWNWIESCVVSSRSAIKTVRFSLLNWLSLTVILQSWEFWYPREQIAGIYMWKKKCQAFERVLLIMHTEHFHQHPQFIILLPSIGLPFPHIPFDLIS